MLKPYNPFDRRVKHALIFLNQDRRSIDIMPPQEEVDWNIKLAVISSQVYVIKLLVNMTECINNATDVVDFIKQPIFR